MDIMGIGYLGFETPNPEKWIEHAKFVLGMQIGDQSPDDDSLCLRMDDRLYRMRIHPGEQDRLAYIGWELPGRDEYRAAIARFNECGVAIEPGDAALCTQRGVRELTRFRDPAGYDHEIFYAPRIRPGTFQAGRPYGGFDAGDKGIGHVVLISPVPIDAIDKLFQDVMGFRYVTHGAGGEATFLNPRLGRRSHCIAFAYIPGKFGIQHLGMAMDTLDSVGMAYQEAKDRQVPLQATLGRHTQDPVISFYHFLPSGFVIETFWEDKPWDEFGPTVELYPDRMSLWGHEQVASPWPTTVREVAQPA